MANPEHLKILKQGVKVWNEWRQVNPITIPDLAEADLSWMQLSRVKIKNNILNVDVGINLSIAKLNKANLAGAVLISANLTKANLTGAYLGNTNLLSAELTDANLSDTVAPSANLERAILVRANFRNSILTGANFTATDLRQANFKKATLALANFNQANLNDSDFSEAFCGGTTFGDNDLRSVKGLTTVNHYWPSVISIGTLYISTGSIPDTFLRGCGVPDDFIAFIPSHFGIQQAIQFYSCFISYNTNDEEFARRLYSRMRDEHLRVWFAPEDVKGGQKLYEQIERAIQVHDRLLVVLSESSLRSKWVMTEIRRARKVELTENRRKLFPIRLVDYGTLQSWECFDADTGEDLAAEVRQYFIPDFSNWKDHDAFERAFARLLRDLKAEEKQA